MKRHLCQNGISTHLAKNCHTPALKGSDFCAVHIKRPGSCVVDKT